MAEKTNIAWCDSTHNFWRGCTKVSDGCKNCYAERLVTTRLGGVWGPGGDRVRSKRFDEPLKWNKMPWACDLCGYCLVGRDGDTRYAPEGHYCGVRGCQGKTWHRRRVFSLSLGDWLDPEVPIEWLADMLDVIRRCPNLDFLLLTKRPEQWKDRIESVYRSPISGETQDWLCEWQNGDAPPNIWLGVSVENQETAEQRIPVLLNIPAAVRFCSYEPALAPVDFSWLDLARRTGTSLDWLIIGGESGPRSGERRARPFIVYWARKVIKACKEQGVAVFMKQVGSNPWLEDGELERMRRNPDYKPLRDYHGGDMTEWPQDIRIQQFPKAV